jgi:LysM repeat protein
MGRQTSQSDYQYGASVYSRSAVYNNKGQLTSDFTSTKKGADTYTSSTTYDYGYGANYALGQAVSVYSTNYKNGNNSQAPDTRTTNAYVWWDGAVQSSITHDGDTGTTSNPIYNTYFAYDGQGRLTGATIGDYLYRSVTFTSDELGQIIRRDETRPYYAPAAQTGSPHEVWYRFAGRQLGYTGNNGTNDLTAAASVGERQLVSPTAGNIGTFRNSSTYGSSYADFAQSYDPLNSYNQGAGSGSYTVRSGDTLQSIAQSLYGDGNLWYKIAEANGLSGNASLIEGRSLTLPAGVAKNTHNTDTFRPYNPQEAIGDLSPTNAKPPKKAKCGGLGAILIAVIAIAVATIVTAGVASLATGTAFSTTLGSIFTAGGLAAAGTAAGGTVGGALAAAAGVAGAVAGSVVSQAVGVATGIQDKFSWKGVALAGIGAGIGAALGGFNAFGKLAEGASQGGVQAIANAVARGALTSAVTQGVGVVTRLQSKFDWAGVAAAGAGAGAAQAIGGNIGGQGKAATATTAATSATFGNFAASTAAGAIANAATRSAINGESFGQNLIAAIPDVVANILQRALGTAVDGVRTPEKVTQAVVTPIANAEANATTGAREEQAVDEKAEQLGDEIVVTGMRVVRQPAYYDPVRIGILRPAITPLIMDGVDVSKWRSEQFADLRAEDNLGFQFVGQKQFNSDGSYALPGEGTKSLGEVIWDTAGRTWDDIMSPIAESFKSIYESMSVSGEGIGADIEYTKKGFAILTDPGDKIPIDLSKVPEIPGKVITMSGSLTIDKFGTFEYGTFLNDRVTGRYITVGGTTAADAKSKAMELIKRTFGTIEPSSTVVGTYESLKLMQGEGFYYSGSTGNKFSPVYTEAYSVNRAEGTLTYAGRAAGVGVAARPINVGYTYTTFIEAYLTGKK